MAIGLGQFKQAGQQMATSERLAKEFAKQQSRAQKRKGWSGLLGKLAGTGLGAGLTGLLGVASGGALAPLLMGIGQFGGKQLAHEATRGMAATTGGLKGDKYGYGREEAEALREGLEAQMATRPSKMKGGFGQDVLGSFLSAGLAGNLGGVGKALGKEGGGWEQFLGVGKDYGTKGGWEGAMAGIGDLFGKPWGADEEDQTVGVSQTPITDYFQQGGQVPTMSPNNLMRLLSSLQEQQGGMGESDNNNVPTISDFFGKQGKSLGGSNKQSLAEILGRR